MSIATTSLKYGWKVLAILTIGTGTIFVADNVLNRITTKDRIEITLAIVERCLATQTGTNPATYGVDPPSIVRTWTDTNGASVIVTNSIAWRDDLSMKIELDAKIQALCPYYVDTDSVYDGTTNIIMHTFTGLLTSLDLGDHTNFTAIPAIGTNAATYGPWAWRNYIVAWQERYKVLEALKMTVIISVSSTGMNTRGYSYGSTNVEYNKSIAVSNYLADTPSPAAGEKPFPAAIPPWAYSAIWREPGWYGALLQRAYGIWSISGISTQVNHAQPQAYIRGRAAQDIWATNEVSIFDAQGDSISTNWTLYLSQESDLRDYYTFIIGNPSFPVPSWGSTPPEVWDATYKGYITTTSDRRVFINWQFNYATEKYW